MARYDTYLEAGSSDFSIIISCFSSVLASCRTYLWVKLHPVSSPNWYPLSSRVGEADLASVSGVRNFFMGSGGFRGSSVLPLCLQVVLLYLLHFMEWFISFPICNVRKYNLHPFLNIKVNETSFRFLEWG